MKNIEYAYHRFCNERFPLPSESQLHELEQRIGVEFPEDYREFILRFNGGYFSEPEITAVGEGCLRTALRLLCGIDALHQEAELAQAFHLTLFEENEPPQIVPIGATGMGSLIILITRPEDAGAIFLKQAFGDFYYLADGIEEFFDLLREPTWE